ncbi:Ig-like domain-containing protein [Neobacillus drentensis]|uniref:Ig-like domain-containing protein n=1 Tax=Neobacillus drentensis TaxID=220684 RepID=UPI002FFF52B0
MKKILYAFLAIFLSSGLVYLPQNTKADSLISNKSVTTPEKATSKDTALVGTTVPNAYVAIRIDSGYGNDTRNNQPERVAKADDKGNFKIFIGGTGSWQAGKTFSLVTYNKDWDIVDTDRVYVYHGSYHQLSGINSDTHKVTGISVKNTKIEVFKDGKSIASGVTDSKGKFDIKLPKFPIGTFLKIQFTNSQGTDTYQEMVGHDWAAGGEVSFNPTTIWSNSISGNAIPNSKIVFYNRYNFQMDKEVSVGSNGHFQFDLDNTVTISKLSQDFIRVYDPVYENVLNIGNSTESIYFLPTTPRVDPISQISTNITGWAPPESNVSVINESDTILAQGRADFYGNFNLPVKSLIAGELLTIQTNMPNTTKADETKTDVQKVYIDDLTDDSGTIDGSSSFGTSAEVTVTSNNTMGSAALSTLSLSSKSKKFGPFRIKQGEEFHLKTGILQAGSKVKITLIAGRKRLSLPEKTVKQVITAPLKSSQVTIRNNKGKSDTVSVKGVTKGSRVKLFNSGGKPIGSWKAAGTTTILSVKQLGQTNGKIYISITRSGLKESKRVAVSYSGEQTNMLAAKQIKIYNNRKTSDVIYVSHLKKNDVIRVYSAAKRGKQWIKPVTAKGSTLKLKIKQLGKKSGKVYVTVTRNGMLESSRFGVGFKSER